MGKYTGITVDFLCFPLPPSVSLAIWSDPWVICLHWIARIYIYVHKTITINLHFVKKKKIGWEKKVWYFWAFWHRAEEGPQWLERKEHDDSSSLLLSPFQVPPLLAHYHQLCSRDPPLHQVRCRCLLVQWDMGHVSRKGRWFLNSRAFRGQWNNPWWFGVRRTAGLHLGFRIIILISTGNWAQEEKSARKKVVKILIICPREGEILDY